MFSLLMLLSALAAEWPTDPDAAAQAWSRTESGVELFDLATGGAPTAEEGSRVVVHYTGMLGDGQIFDSSLDRGQPFTFTIGQHQVIRGWEDGLIGAAPGTRRRLVIPPAQGYGERAAGPIPPGSTLYFEIEVLEVVAPRKPPGKPTPTDPEGFRRLGPEGLQFVDLVEGDGERPVKGERVCVDWSVWSQGTVVDHTFALERCRWFRYESGKVIDGIYEGIRTMREGGVRQIRVPPALAAAPYRPAGVPPDETVLVEVRLIEAIQPK